MRGFVVSEQAVEERGRAGAPLPKVTIDAARAQSGSSSG